MLADYLRQTREVATFDHPDKVGLGAELRRMKFIEKLKFSIAAELLLHAADFAEMAITRLGPALASGATVLCHRWWSSALVYQGYVDGCPARAVEQAYATTLQILAHDTTEFVLPATRPDVLILLNVSPKIAMGRLRKRAELETFRYENEEKVERACGAFKTVGAHHVKAVCNDHEKLVPTTGLLAKNVLILNTDNDHPEETHAKIRSALGLA
jgi:thymidylate kinase